MPVCFTKKQPPRRMCVPAAVQNRSVVKTRDAVRNGPCFNRAALFTDDRDLASVKSVVRDARDGFGNADSLQECAGGKGAAADCKSSLRDHHSLCRYAFERFAFNGLQAHGQIQHIGQLRDRVRGLVCPLGIKKDRITGVDFKIECSVFRIVVIDRNEIGTAAEGIVQNRSERCWEA